MSYNDTDIGDTCVIPSENIVELCELKKYKKYVSLLSNRPLWRKICLVKDNI